LTSDLAVLIIVYADVLSWDLTNVEFWFGQPEWQLICGIWHTFNYACWSVMFLLKCFATKGREVQIWLQFFNLYVFFVLCTDYNSYSESVPSDSDSENGSLVLPISSLHSSRSTTVTAPNILRRNRSNCLPAGTALDSVTSSSTSLGGCSGYQFPAVSAGDDITDDFCTDLQPLFVVPDHLPDFDTSHILVRCTPDNSPERSLLFSPSQVHTCRQSFHWFIFLVLPDLAVKYSTGCPLFSKQHKLQSPICSLYLNLKAEFSARLSPGIAALSSMPGIKDLSHKHRCANIVCC
jgi:hypothetical protein